MIIVLNGHHSDKDACNRAGRSCLNHYLIVYMRLLIELRGRVVEDGLFQDLRDQGGSAIYQRTSLVTPPISSCIGGNQGYKVNTAHELVLA